MSLFSDIANTIGHTVDSLAATVGADVSTLETVVNDLDSNGVDVFSMATRLGLSMEGFLSGIVNLMRSDPHQLLLQRLTGPARPMDDALSQLAQHWAQVAYLHQDTAQTIHMHVNELFQGNGADSYSGSAADSLLSKHQDYQKYFTELVEHAQTQHMRHATLGNHVNDYLGQAPGKVYSLSAPMAAFSVLGLESAGGGPSSSVLDDPAVQNIDNAMQSTLATGEQIEQEDPDPSEVSEFSIAVVIGVVLLILAIVWVIVVIVSALHDALTNHQNQQKNTVPTSKPPKGVGPGPGSQNSLTPAQQRLHNDVASRLAGTTYDSREIDDLIRAGYLDPDAIAAIIKGGRGTFAVFNNPNNAAMMNELTPAQQLKFITIVEQYQATHPTLTSEQVLNYLRYMKMKSQGQKIYDELTSSDPTSIAQRYPTDTGSMLNRFNKDFWNPILRVSDPFVFTDEQLDGGYKNLVGFWGEWASIKQSDAKGRLVHFNVPITGGEVDIQEKDANGNPLRWIEIKNGSVKSNWKSALPQVQNYIARGATEVVIQLPQQGKPGFPLPGVQQVQALQTIQNQHPTIKFDVVVAEPTDKASWDALNNLKNKFPKIHFETMPSTSSIPYDPPAGDWGNQLP